MILGRIGWCMIECKNLLILRFYVFDCVMISKQLQIGEDGMTTFEFLLY